MACETLMKWKLIEHCAVVDWNADTADSLKAKLTELKKGLDKGVFTIDDQGVSAIDAVYNLFKQVLLEIERIGTVSQADFGQEGFANVVLMRGRDTNAKIADEGFHLVFAANDPSYAGGTNIRCIG